MPERCEACGSADDDGPRHHYGNESYHFDCLPYKVVRDLTTEGYWHSSVNPDTGVVSVNWIDGPEVPPEDLHPEIAKALKLRDAALSGIHGDKLVALATKED